MPDDAHVYLWPDDRAALIEIVRQLEHEGAQQVNTTRIIEQLGIENSAFHRGIARLADADMITTAGGTLAGGTRDGYYMIQRVTDRGLRAAGAWPTEAETIATQLVAALCEAAANTPDPDQRSKLRAAADSVAASDTRRSSRSWLPTSQRAPARDRDQAAPRPSTPRRSIRHEQSPDTSASTASCASWIRLLVAAERNSSPVSISPRTAARAVDGSVKVVRRHRPHLATPTGALHWRAIRSLTTSATA